MSELVKNREEIALPSLRNLSTGRARMSLRRLRVRDAIRVLVRRPNEGRRNEILSASQGRREGAIRHDAAVGVVAIEIHIEGWLRAVFHPAELAALHVEIPEENTNTAASPHRLEEILRVVVERAIAETNLRDRPVVGGDEVDTVGVRGYLTVDEPEVITFALGARVDLRNRPKR